MTTAESTDVTTVQVYRVWIRATPQAIWDAITDPEWTDRYGYQGRAEFDLRPGGAFRAGASADMKAYGGPDVVVEGEVIEADPPRRLVQTWHPIWDPQVAAEKPTRLTYEIAEGEHGVTKLTVIHDVEGAPGVATMVSGGLEHTGAGGGWAFVLSDLKSLLETGRALAA
jgi:uncharacterized protein YndB with AHSA1/START domain